MQQSNVFNKLPIGEYNSKMYCTRAQWPSTLELIPVFIAQSTKRSVGGVVTPPGW